MTFLRHILRDIFGITKLDKEKD